MNIHRLSDAGIRNSGLMFVPAGLPLVSKAGKESPTTSILVRGGPGTGKTTMSLALAHAIARENAGVVLFLTTEFSPAEVVAKAGLLGLPEESVFGWERRTEVQQGSILVQHLAATGLTEPDDEASISAGQKQRAMQAIWNMLGDSGAPPAVPIRALVIDAFGLPDAQENSGKLRSDLVPFIQALEKRGISTVLVEEALAGGPDWLAFVTDIVFELSFQADPDTRELHRKIVCKKSRYAQAIPGPHDYGLDVDQRRPSVFPDPLLSLGNATDRLTTIPKEGRAALFIPLDEDGLTVLVYKGALILNAFDRAGGKLTHAFDSTPGLEAISWQCGPVSTITGGDRRIRLHESAGPYAICYAILDRIGLGKGNAVEIHNVGALAASSRYRAGLPRVFEALRRRGCLVLVHGLSAELAAFLPFADVNAEEQTRGSLRISPGRYCPVTVHLPPIDLLAAIMRAGPFDSMPGETDGLFAQQILDAVRASETARSRHDIQSAIADLNLLWDESDHVAWNPWIAIAYFLLSISLRRLGAKNDPRHTYIQMKMPDLGHMGAGTSDDELLVQFDSHMTLHGPLAWAFAVMGNEPAAAYWCLRAFERTESAATMNGLLWLAVQATFAPNEKALEGLLKLATAAQHGPLFVGFALRALVARRRVNEIDDVVTRYAQNNPMVPFMVRRLRVEPLLDARDRGSHVNARDELLSLVALPDIPPIHRAEISHNLGYAHELLGDLANARACYERARLENPHLTIAAEALARFDKPPVVDPARKPPEQSRPEDEPNDASNETGMEENELPPATSILQPGRATG